MEVGALMDNAPGVLFVVGLGERNDVADVLVLGYVVLRGLPLDGDGGFGDVLDVQMLAWGSRSLVVSFFGGDGKVCVRAGVPEHVAILVIGHHEDGVGRVGLQILEGVHVESLSLAVDTPHVAGTGLVDPDEVLDVGVIGGIISGPVPPDGDRMVGFIHNSQLAVPHGRSQRVAGFVFQGRNGYAVAGLGIVFNDVVFVNDAHIDEIGGVALQIPDGIGADAFFFVNYGCGFTRIIIGLFQNNFVE